MHTYTYTPVAILALSEKLKDLCLVASGIEESKVGFVVVSTMENSNGKQCSKNPNWSRCHGRDSDAGSRRDPARKLCRFNASTLVRQRQLGRAPSERQLEGGTLPSSWNPIRESISSQSQKLKVATKSRFWIRIL